MSPDAQSRARQTWLCARRALGGDISALEFGAAESAVVAGDGAEPARVIPIQLGVSALARRYLDAPRLAEAAIEAAIAEVEDRVMPLRPLLAPGTRHVTRDREVRAVAEVLEPVTKSWVALSTDAVEQVFNRWVSIALGRPATQDALPTSGEFAATLLVLREWLHHLSCKEITLLVAGSSYRKDDAGTSARGQGV